MLASCSTHRSPVLWKTSYRIRERLVRCYHHHGFMRTCRGNPGLTSVWLLVLIATVSLNEPREWNDAWSLVNSVQAQTCGGCSQQGCCRVSALRWTNCLKYFNTSIFFAWINKYITQVSEIRNHCLHVKTQERKVQNYEEQIICGRSLMQHHCDAECDSRFNTSQNLSASLQGFILPRCSSLVLRWLYRTDAPQRAKNNAVPCAEPGSD